MHFSKALFKQSMKANWVKWLCVTVATCVMLAIVIIVLGSLAINDIRDSLKDVFTQADQQSYLKENTVDSYEAYTLSVDFASQLDDPMLSMFAGTAYNMAVSGYQEKIDAYTEANGQAPTGEALETIKEEAATEFITENESILAMLNMTDEEISQFLYIIYMTHDNNPTLDTTNNETVITELKESFVEYAGLTAYNLYISQGETEEVANGYRLQAVELANTAINSYEQKSQEEGFVYDEEVFKEEANEYVINMIYTQTYNQFITSETPTEEEISNAEQYAVAAKVLANTAISTYELWIDELTGSEMTDAEIKAYAKEQASASITDQIPEKVAEALEELGNMDIYGLIIGSIFYRIAGILLPMVFVIMVANGLLAGQVDSGSMAYVLSTPTKRRTVACTQMAYLMLSLLAMFILVTVTSVISIWVVGGNNFAINFAEICLFNLGAFLTMFAFAGYCFMCSAIFNRSKYSMSIGGGLSIFMLVCTILGLFGSNVVPSAMRIDAMNVFNYFSIISLFDTVSILNGTISFAWKFAILAGIAIVTFIIGVFRFEKKDLPL